MSQSSCRRCRQKHLWLTAALQLLFLASTGHAAGTDPRFHVSSPVTGIGATPRVNQPSPLLQDNNSNNDDDVLMEHPSQATKKALANFKEHTLSAVLALPRKSWQKAILVTTALGVVLVAYIGHATRPDPQPLQPYVSSSTTPLTSTATAETTTLDEPAPVLQYNNDNTENENEVSRGGSTSLSLNEKKLANLRERTLSAVLMLGGLILWVHNFREKGMMLLVLIIQAGVYREGTNIILPSVVGGDGKSALNHNNKPPTSWIKWWWYLAYELLLVGPRLLTTKSDGSPLLSASSIYLGAFGMIAAGIMSFVVTLNNSIAFSYEFQLAVQELASYHLAIALVVIPSSFWVALLQDYGMQWVLYALSLVMINDTMAYVFGASIGKHPMLPTISPKKTWEGFLGALVSTMAMSIVLWDKMNFVGVPVGTGIKHALLIAAYCSLVAPFGGFLASIVKRAYGKKDFSNMIAGHGGFVDRLDCQLITAPFMYLYLRQFVQPLAKF